MKIIFMGTPDFAKESLEAVYNSGNEILAVVTNPDKPKGRGMKMTISPVKEFALEKNLKILQPSKVRKNEEFIEGIKGMQPDLLCVVAYGKILPKELLDIPKYGAINVHGSLLPQYRGSAPIQWAVINGDKKTGITTMFMDEGMDTGDMILKEETEIGDNETTGELWERLSKIGSKLLVGTINKIDCVKNKENKTLDEIKEEIGAEKQGENYSLAPMLSKEMAKIDWQKKGVEIKNLVRGLNPIMGAYCFLENKKIKLWKVQVLNLEELEQKFSEIKDYMPRMKNVEPGTVLFADKKKGLFVKTTDGVLEILELQGENAKKMDVKSFLNGNDIHAGEIFE